MDEPHGPPMLGSRGDLAPVVEIMLTKYLLEE
jgi:hypothetical protein